MDNLNKIAQLTKDVDDLMNFKHQIIKAVNTSHEGIAILDKEGNYTYVNEAHETMFGYDKGELYGKNWTVIYKPEEVERFKTSVFPTIEKDGRWSGEATAIKKDGITPVNEMVYLTSLSDGGLICTCRDRGFEINKWEILFNKLPFGVVIATTKGYFKNVNPAFISMLGYSEKELLTIPFTDFIHPDDLPITYEKIGELSTLKPVIGFVNRYIDKSGEWIKLEWTSTATPDGEIFALVKEIKIK